MTLLIARRGPIAAAGQGAAVPFSPSDLSNLALWFKADAITGLVNGDPVATWSDESGNTRDATQATAAKQPTYATAVQNGLPVVRFSDASSQRLATAAFAAALTQPNTIFVVGNHAATGGTRGYFIDGIASGNRQAFARGLGSDNGKFGLFAGAASASNVDGPLVTIPTGMLLWTVVFNGASSSIRKSRAAYSSGDPGSHSLSGLSIGSGWSDAFGYLPGDVGEIIVYDRALTTAERDQVEQHLTDKWAV